MMRFLILLFVALITFGILYYANNPQALDDIGLYFVGLAGAIIKLFQILWGKIKSLGADVDNALRATEEAPPPVIQSQSSPPTILQSTGQNDAVG